MTRASTPIRQAVLFMAIALGLALAVVLIAPKTGSIAPLLSIPLPLIATAIVIALTTPAGRRRQAWAGIGFGLGRTTLRWLVPAVVLPLVLAAVSCTIAAAFGVVSLSASVPTALVAMDFLFSLVVFSVVFMGEEIGWRGFLLPRVASAIPFGRAALVTGLLHGVFHLPLYLIGSTYMTAGGRWVVVPLAMVSFTFGGVFYAWLRKGSGSVWPVAVGHEAFNAGFTTLGKLSTVSSPVALAYLTNETGAVTGAITAIVAVVLLARSRVFRTEPPSLGAPSTVPQRLPASPLTGLRSL